MNLEITGIMGSDCIMVSMNTNRVAVAVRESFVATLYKAKTVEDARCLRTHYKSESITDEASHLRPGLVP